MISKDFLDELRAKIDLVELASQYTTLKQAGIGTYIGNCPNKHHKDKTPSFTISTNKGPYHMWNCFGCNREINGEKYSGEPIGFYRFVNDGMEFYKAVLELCERTNTSIPSVYYAEQYIKNFKIMKACNRNLFLNQKALGYLYSRGLSTVDINKYGLGYIYEPILDIEYKYMKISGKIIIPFLNSNNSVIGFSKRWIEKPNFRGDKYRHSHDGLLYQKKAYFYGINLIDKSFKEIRITEGVFDVMLADKYKAKNVVSTLGVELSDSHAEMIKGLGMSVTLIYDSDAAGIAGINKAAIKLSEYDIECKILILPTGMDLCDISNIQKYGIENYINEHAILYSQYIVSNLVNEYQSKKMELDLLYYKKFKEALLLVPNNLERKILKDKINNEFKISI